MINRKYAKYSILLVALMLATAVRAQVGEYRNKFMVGVSGGMTLSSVGFTPKVPQNLYSGLTYGIVARYTSEKYFSTICSVQLEVNYSQSGWKQKIETITEEPVINKETGVAEEYARRQNYVQIPVFAHLAWGKEINGLQFFVDLGPMIGLFLNEETVMNYDKEKMNIDERTSPIIEQESMPIENKIDYGIAAGAGMEYSFGKIGSIYIAGRYNLSLGNIYGNSKKDYFAKSNHGDIVFKGGILLNI